MVSWTRAERERRVAGPRLRSLTGPLVVSVAFSCATASGPSPESQRDPIHAEPSPPFLGSRVVAPSAPDEDGDGILASADRCPAEPGIEPDGCPLRDTDEDGILDPEDECPGQAERPNGYQDADGCPDELPEDLAGILGPIEGLRFEFNKSIIRKESHATLDLIVEVLLRYPDTVFEIEGHRDSKGRYSRVKITQRRADSVRDYFIRRGVEARRLEARGYGEDRPIESNKTEEGRARNRRIELTLLCRDLEGPARRCAAS